jgi:hypothetical protein
VPLVAVSTTTVFGIFLAVLMALGYVAIWALWHFVFRHAPPDDPREDPARQLPQSDGRPQEAEGVGFEPTRPLDGA